MWGSPHVSLLTHCELGESTGVLSLWKQTGFGGATKPLSSTQITLHDGGDGKENRSPKITVCGN